MKILIISDTHRRDKNYFKVLEREAPVDMVIHCGDTEGSEHMIMDAAKCPTYIVLGNNDFFSDLEREEEIQIGKYRVFVTHGHNYYVSMNNEIIKGEARNRGCDIVMYGHTHKPVIEIEDDIIAVNPGSLTYPRQENRRPSYIVMNINSAGEASFSMEYL